MNLKAIEKAMRKLKLPDEVLAQMNFDSMESAAILALLSKLPELLSEKQRYAIYDQLGCCKTGKYDAASKAFAKEHAGQPLTARITAMHHEGDAPYLNEDGTIGITVRCAVDELLGTFLSCHCIRRSHGKVFTQELVERGEMDFAAISQEYCGCCSGHWRHHLQRRLGVKLHLKKIGASLRTGDTVRMREFVYEIVE